MKKSIVFFVIILLPISSPFGTGKSEKEFFVFEPDIRLFTVYAYMNAAGYDHDWNDTMHPIRTGVRNYLDSVLTDDYKKKIYDYYNKLGGGDFYGYGAYVLSAKFPPDFGLVCDTCRNDYIEKFVNFDSILREFFVKASIEDLWQKYKNRLYEINVQYKPYAETALRQITGYCRVDSNFFSHHVRGHFHYQEIPLMSYFTAFFHETENDYWVIRGPSKGNPGPEAFYHESLHRIVNPIVESNPEINNKITPLVKLSQERLKGNYNNETLILCESMVRSISIILGARYNQGSKRELEQRISDEYRLGHILSFYLLEHLPDYEESEKPLEEYYPELIANIDIDYEKSRWWNYWKDNKDE